MTEHGTHGPIDYLILEYPSGTSGEQSASALRDLVDRGIVRIFDILVLRKDEDGTCRAVQLQSPDAELSAMGLFAGARSGLLGADDVISLAEILEPGKAALALVYENVWAAPFVAAARGEGADVIASARLTADEIMDALEAVEAVEVTS
jgi:uncharacterized membrane protein